MLKSNRTRDASTIAAFAVVAALGGCRASTSAGRDARGDDVTAEVNAGESGAGGEVGACPHESAGTTHVAPCPPSCPTAGSACTPDGAHCEYGDDPRGPACRLAATCLGGSWYVVPPPSPQCEALVAASDCPTSSAAASNQACAVEHSWCSVPTDGADCICTTCAWTNGLFLKPCPAGTPHWQCAARPAGLDARCPPVPPTLGTSCTTDVSCRYQCGPIGTRACQGGVWTGIDGGRCPV